MNITLKPLNDGQRLPGQAAGGRFHVNVGEITLCSLDHWALDSCGMVSLFAFTRDYNAPDWWRSEANTKEFIKFLKNVKFSDGWDPKEFIFALADWQIKQTESTYTAPSMHHLIADPHVMKLDQFTNKAHGPSDIHLFRLSFGLDFDFLEGKKE